MDIETFEISARTIERLKEAFHRRHEELYTYSERHGTVEVVNIESTIQGLIDKPKTPTLAKGKPPAKALKGQRKAIFDASGKAAPTPIYDGSLLGAGAVIAGPAIIEEITTTIVVEPGWTASLHESGSYVITATKAKAASKGAVGRIAKGIVKPPSTSAQEASSPSLKKPGRAGKRASGRARAKP